MDTTTNISFMIAFSAGLLSFISPCVLPLVPSYVSYITGLSLEELTSSKDKRRMRALAIKNSLVFILGFSTIFTLLGASTTFVGQFFLQNQAFIRQIGGVLIIFFGLYIMGLFKFSILARDTRLHFKTRPAGYLGSYFIGVAFGAGWTPCVGPILGSILVYASTSGSVLTGVELLAVYSLGLGLPLLLASVGIQYFLFYFKKTAKYMGWISRTSGAFLVIVGVMIFTNSLARLTTFFTEIGIGAVIGQ
ncbi:Cytochrome c-type biogenesis protein CcdA (DsbD analog) [hydrothermal vent metagenome]|uniref:Cytochrome c-type biogenesis protein CcdA (DsbD analog) n=1 Tax=hydrothermal vent metagenome TaxID=652676 RepID=A0A3B1D1N7_9ZZZZ